MHRIRPSLAALLLTGSLLVVGAGPVAGGNAGMATGGGHVLFAGVIDLTFSFGAVQHSDGRASGSFKHSFVFEGQRIEYWGRVTCVSFDAAEGRAWIGGVLTKVTSTHPAVVEVPGDDAWFRVLDVAPGGSGEPDRSTFMGFEGSAGIITSEQYCTEMPWPDDNDRTHPVVSGNITVSG